MKAVNLIPADAGAGRRTRTGAAVYAVLGALALLVVLTGVYTLAARTVHQRQRELAAVTEQAKATESQAAALKTYVQYSNLRKARVETVKNLVDGRLDWAHALREIARTLPAGSWVTSLSATVNPGVSVGGGSDPLRAALAVPAIELGGCSTSQQSVARMVASLRAIAGVQRVSLAKTQKLDAGANGLVAGDGCGSDPQFALTIFYEAPASPAGAPTSSGGTTP